MNLLIVAVIVAFFSGCVTSISKDASLIKEADEKAIQSCTFLGNVDGSATFAGITADGLHESAKSEALDKAVQLKATHVVWLSVQKGFDSGASVLGKAYACH
ncbi:MAG: hypothetical protein H7256_13465 [Bdellovibrio sp.]|nr:hypothetical protein [Bdellovibrio sp.]